ncbi:SsgA family sporulation/cell division regulator [Streptomyces graminilatus]|uniref:SsgA family sporulation/cell division regulator n=1 Tax=Streptomyces graminilatus TaxID=1464070 RepID=UPI0006E3B3C0|nr:SsgA family sporulation/cell division regulator [Streptomyces graminilatus]
MSVVEQYARAHIVTDTEDDDRGPVPVVLRYDPDADPRVVRIRLPGSPGLHDPRDPHGPHEWTFSRSLLEEGLRAPVGSGEVRVWPCGRVQAVVEFHSAGSVSVVQFETKTLMRFLRRTYMAGARVSS